MFLTSKPQYKGFRILDNTNNPDEPYRTPIGAFGNHSDDPNCSKMYFDDDGSWWVFANRDIKEGEEITWRYTLYEV